MSEGGVGAPKGRLERQAHLSLSGGFTDATEASNEGYADARQGDGKLSRSMEAGCRGIHVHIGGLALLLLTLENFREMGHTYVLWWACTTD